MGRNPLVRIILGIVVACAVCLPCANAQVLDLGTAGRAGSFFITGAGAVGATAFSLSDPQGRTPIDGISLSSDGTAAGTFVRGGTAENFDGFWIAEETFFCLPTPLAPR